MVWGRNWMMQSSIRQAKDADVYQNIIEFPKKASIPAWEKEGLPYPGGQKQRVSIARAVAKSPRILLLDDCLSAVDTKTGECHFEFALEKNQ